MTGIPTKRRLGIVVAVFLFITGTWLIVSQWRGVTGLTGSEVAEMRAAVRKELWNMFPTNFSLDGVRFIPVKMWYIYRTEIAPPRPTQPGTFAVSTSGGFPHFNGQYELSKRNGHWIVVRNLSCFVL
jgi:hypothetical protein